MDLSSLKKDNRKKFQDKQKLKSRHATPSDRKYRVINQTLASEKSEEETKKEEEEKQLPSNTNRYDEYTDLVEKLDTDEGLSTDISRKLRDIIKERSNAESTHEDIIESMESGKAKITQKLISNMKVDDLNRLLGNTKISTSKNDDCVVRNSSKDLKSTNFETKTPNKIIVSKYNMPVLPSTIPSDLNDDEDFLDGLI